MAFSQEWTQVTGDKPRTTHVVRLLRPFRGIPEDSIQGQLAPALRLPECHHREACSWLGRVRVCCHVFIRATDPIFYVLCQKIIKCGTKEMIA